MFGVVVEGVVELTGKVLLPATAAVTFIVFISLNFIIMFFYY